MAQTIKETVANKGRVVTPSKFGSYDFCANPYVGCQMGCTYCYVRFFVKDKKREWGDFVRTRNHVKDNFKHEAKAIKGKRLVIGTMTDPYQPVERKHRLTRHMLETLKELGDDGPTKIGIFTRSPIVLDDLELIKSLGPRARVHFTVTPYSREILRRIEPIPIRTDVRFGMADKFCKAGIWVHLGISPIIPNLCEDYTVSFCEQIAKIQPHGFVVDPMQAYGEAFTATAIAMRGHNKWPKSAEIMQDKGKYGIWKRLQYEAWFRAWEPYRELPINPIFMDHQSKLRKDLRTGNKHDFYEPPYEE